MTADEWKVRVSSVARAAVEGYPTPLRLLCERLAEMDVAIAAVLPPEVDAAGNVTLRPGATIQNLGTSTLRFGPPVVAG